MKDLWLDDERPAPDGWVHVKSVLEAVGYCTQYAVNNMSLDHDLGEDQQTGYDFLRWLYVNEIKPHGRIEVHSQNPVGKKQMEQFVERYLR